MNNTEVYLQTLLSLLGIIIPVIISWISSKLKEQRNIYTSHKYLFCNSSMYYKIMHRIIINIALLGIITIVSMAIGASLKVYPFEIIVWLGIYTLAYVLQIKIMGKGYYGLDKYGNRKNYTPCIRLFIGLMDIDMLIVLIIKNTTSIIIGYIFEVLLVTFFTYYIINIKKVKYCEQVIFTLKHKKPKTIAIENFQLEEDGSVIIHNQNRSNVQISGSLIKKKKAVYSAEYLQWADKIQNFNIKDEMVRDNNSDIRWGWVILMAVIPVVISIIDFKDWSTYGNGEIRRWIAMLASNANLLSDLFSQQMTISTIVIAAASLVVNNIDDRFIGASTKCILFKKFIFYFNYITIILILLAINVSSFASYLLQSKWGLIVSFIVSMIWLFKLLKLTYYLLSKKSKIYFMIRKKLDIELKKKKDFVVYNTLINKLNALEERNPINKSNLIHDSYFVDEMLVLYKMQSIACTFGKDDHKTIDYAKKYYINREERSGEKLRKSFEQYKCVDCQNTIEWLKEDLDKK